MGAWLGAAFDQGAKHWRPLVLASLALVGILVVLMFVMITPLMLTGAILGELDEGLMVAGILAILFIFGGFATLVFSPLWLGFYRGILSLCRGQGWPTGALLSGLPQTFASTMLTVLTLVLVLGGTMLCYVPGLLVGTLLLFSIPVMADERCGPIEAMKRSAELVQPQLWMLAGYWLLANFISGMVTQLPIVGLLIAFPLQALLVCVPYLVLKGELDLGSKSA